MAQYYFACGYIQNEEWSFNPLLAKPRQNTAAILTSYELFIYGNRITLLIHFVKNVL
jgi:hypothetical protein